MNDYRPKNLNLFSIRFPIPAIVSILHRISGFFLFLLIPFVLYALSYSLTMKGFKQISQLFDLWWVKFGAWLVLASLGYHLIAGLRHLLSDLHFGDTLRAGRFSAYMVFLFAIVLAVLLGVWIW